VKGRNLDRRRIEDKNDERIRSRIRSKKEKEQFGRERERKTEREREREREGQRERDSTDKLTYWKEKAREQVSFVPSVQCSRP